MLWVRCKERDITARLPEIDTPTLVTSGRYDEVTPAMAAIVHQGIRGSECVVFEKSAHMTHLEELEGFVTVVEAFLARHEH